MSTETLKPTKTVGTITITRQSAIMASALILSLGIAIGLQGTTDKAGADPEIGTAVTVTAPPTTAPLAPQG